MKLIILGLFWPALAFSAIAVNGSQVSAGGSGSTSYTTVSTLNTASGSMNAVCAFASTSAGTLSVTDSQSNSYTKLTTNTRGSGGYAVQIFYATNITGNSAQTYTFHTPNSTSFSAFTVINITGLATASPKDADVASTGSTGTSITSSSFSTLSANEIILACLPGSGSGGTVTPGSGYTWEGYDGAFGECGFMYKIVSSTQSVITASATMQNSIGWGISVASFWATAPSSGVSFTPGVY